jgi:ribonuclease HI
MSTIHPFHIRYDDGANRSSYNMAYAAWVIFSPNNEFLDSGGIFLDRATNNIVEYVVVITLMTNASALVILSLVVRLDSKLVIS